jgi:hypothetical protein
MHKKSKETKSWDALPSKSEAEEIKPLLTRIAQLKAATNKELNGTQLIPSTPNPAIAGYSF